MKNNKGILFVLFGLLLITAPLLGSSIEHPFSGLIKTGSTIKPANPTDQLQIDSIEFTEDDTDPTCNAGNYNLYADLSETALKVCQDGVTSILGGAASEWTDTGTVLHPNELTDDVSIGSATLINGAKLSIDGDADQVQFAIQGFAGQAANFMEMEDSAGNELFHFTSSGQLGIQHTGVLGNDHSLQITTNANGLGDIKGISALYTTGAIDAVEHANAILVNIDESLSTGGIVAGLEVISTDAGASTVYGMVSGVGVNPMLHQSGVFEAVDFCEEETTGPIFTDCVTAFNATGTDIQIWDADNDRIYLGKIVTFESISWLFDTVTGNPGIMPIFEYSQAGPTWVVFTPTDGTNGARNNGVMDWETSNLAGWATAVIDGDSAFWIRITRTAVAITGPTEDLVQVASPVTFSWNKDGNISANGLTLVNDLAVGIGGTGASTFIDGGILLGSGVGAITALGVAANGQIPIGDGTTDPVLATITGTANEITVTNSTGTITLDLPDLLLINETANGNMSQGITIKQNTGIANQSFSAKSVDVGTGLTTLPTGGNVETDDYFSIEKSGAAGGVKISGFVEFDDGSPSIRLYGYGGVAQTTDTTNSTGLIDMKAVQHDGSNGFVNAATDANLFSIRARFGGGDITRFVLKADDGELHLGVTALVALDSHNDNALITDFENFRTQRQLIADFATMNIGGAYARLVDIGLVGAVSEEDWNNGVRPLVSVQRSIHLLNGDARQSHGRIEAMLDILEEDPTFRAKMQTKLQARGLGHLAR